MQRNTQRDIMFFVTWLLDSVVAGAARISIWALFFSVPFYMLGGEPLATVMAVGAAIVFGILPPLVSLIVFYSPWIPAVAENFFLRRVMGRHVTQLEAQRIINIVASMPEQARRVRVSDVYVHNYAGVPSFTIGHSIFIGADYIDSEYVDAILAHEMGHIVARDGRMMLAFLLFFGWWFKPEGEELLFFSSAYVLPYDGWNPRKLKAGFLNWFERSMGTSATGVIGTFFFLMMRIYFALAMGGLFFGLFQAYWLRYFMQSEFEADAYAYLCGKGGQMQAFLNDQKRIPSNQIQPQIEYRLESLRNLFDQDIPNFEDAQSTSYDTQNVA